MKGDYIHYLLKIKWLPRKKVSNLQQAFYNKQEIHSE